MTLLTERELHRAFNGVMGSRDVQEAVEKYHTAFRNLGHVDQKVDVTFLGPVFRSDPDPPFIEDVVLRRRAADMHSFQLVYFSDEKVSLDIRSFSSFNKAKKMLASLRPDEYGSGGGVLLHSGQPMNGQNNLYDKYNFKHYSKTKTINDFVSFWRRAAFYVRPVEPSIVRTNVRLVRKQLLERLRQLTAYAPEFIKMKSRFEASDELPEIIYGKPSNVLIEYARMFPEHVRLGGCKGIDPKQSEEIKELQTSNRRRGRPTMRFVHKTRGIRSPHDIAPTDVDRDQELTRITQAARLAAQRKVSRQPLGYPTRHTQVRSKQFTQRTQPRNRGTN